MKKILHISDIHYSEDYFRKTTIYSELMSQMEGPFSQLEKVLKDEEENYDLVLVSGDICEYGSEEEYQTVRKLLNERFSCPVLVTCGNHDIPDNLIKGFALQVVKNELFEVYTVDDLRVICLNSGHPDHNDGFISETSCDLLEEELKKNVSHTLIMTHHHLISQQFTMPKAEYPERLKEIIRKGDVMAILTGHTHHLYESEFEGKKYFTTGSLSFVVDENDQGKLLFHEEPSALVYYIDDEIQYRILKPEKGRDIGYLPI